MRDVCPQAWLQSAVGYTVQFDLNFTLFERDDGLEGQVLYSMEIFDRSTVARIIEIYCAVLETVCSRPELSMSQFKLPALSQAT